MAINWKNEADNITDTTSLFEDNEVLDIENQRYLLNKDKKKHIFINNLNNIGQKALLNILKTDWGYNFLNKFMDKGTNLSFKYRREKY